MRGNLRFSKLYRISVYSPKTGDYTEYSEICKGDKAMANKSMGEMITTMGANNVPLVLIVNTSKLAITCMNY